MSASGIAGTHTHTHKRETHNKFMFMQMARNAILLSLYKPIVQAKLLFLFVFAGVRYFYCFFLSLALYRTNFDLLFS